MYIVLYHIFFWFVPSFNGTTHPPNTKENPCYYLILFVNKIWFYFLKGKLYFINNIRLFVKYWVVDIYRGGSRGGVHLVHAQINWKKWFFCVKSWFFTQKFLVLPLTSNPGSAPDLYVLFMWFFLFFVITYVYI